MGMSKKVLIVDDERLLHAMMKPVFSAHGFEVVSAMTGEEGLALAASEKPDLIILDLDMPIMNGFEACKRIRYGKGKKIITELFRIGEKMTLSP